MSEHFDAIVIGSGFGGSIVACRLAEKQMKVLVLERGRRWSPDNYPRQPADPWFFNVNKPEKQNGWLDLRLFKHMIVAQAAGVGGGSLAYSSVMLEAHPSCFDQHWPAELTHSELKPHYDRVARELNFQTLPDGQLTARLKLTRAAAEKTGHADRFAKAPLAVSFSPDWHYGLDRPFDHKHSRTFTNAQGQQQGTCIHLGNCDIGCDVRAKNGLDVTYLATAEQHGCEVRPLHLVRSIEPQNGRYRVQFDRIAEHTLVPGVVTATHVFVAAGSLGSTELLLRARDQHRTLPKLSPMLGERWSANANVLSMATYKDETRVEQSVGPTITAAIDFMDGAAGGRRFVIEDDGFPNLLTNALRAAVRDAGGMAERSFLGKLEHLQQKSPRGLMLWLGAGVDAGDGRLQLRPHWLPPFRQELSLRWEPEGSIGVIEEIIATHRRMTDATGGRPETDLGWQLFRQLLTLHPLGGCRMADDAESGVVDHLGRVFGYENLYVVDGAIVPAPIGRNPSHTIAALAERIAGHVA